MTRQIRHKEFLTPKDVATLLRVKPGTVRLWTQDGRLRTTLTPGGHRRFSYHDVEQFARKHNIAIPTRAGDSLRVLVVDDDKRLARMIKKMLLSTDDSIQVELAHDGFVAGQTIEKFKPHVVILDLVMPGVDGFELCKLLKNNPETLDVRIIAITGNPNPAAAKKILRLGAEVCIPKPVKAEELISAVGL